ncbi:tRNA1(Val) (adenine(37)-N6)-methyltransferase [Striga asiatica]|uniref:tRNA1(Val) (Adenine(37)-N6)-methyltransferase n=1 Tax=Striga asiatica TaxID=4170 RepID=A0A5A7PL04_STRAF|nr:tRNA1(Val) (adenine(37)-N6)-methyltransferase [Striga asiatica]
MKRRWLGFWLKGSRKALDLLQPATGFRTNLGAGNFWFSDCRRLGSAGCARFYSAAGKSSASGARRIASVADSLLSASHRASSLPRTEASSRHLVCSPRRKSGGPRSGFVVTPGGRKSDRSSTSEKAPPLPLLCGSPASRRRSSNIKGRRLSGSRVEVSESLLVVGRSGCRSKL